MPFKIRTQLRVFVALLVLIFFSSIFLKEKKDFNDEHFSLSTQEVSKGLGVSLGLFASDPSWDYWEFLEELSALRVTRLMLVIPLKQTDHQSSAPWLGVPLSTIERTVRQAKSLRFHLSLMPVILLQNRSMDRWRGVLNPEDLDAWWSNYNSDIRRLADLAQREGFERFVIGAELCSLESQIDRWRSLIQSLRTRFNGYLTYSANWDHYQEVPFWALLDEVSITAYFPLISLETLEEEWQGHLNEMERFAQSITVEGHNHKTKGRPLVVSEYGYPALKSALSRPWDETYQADFDPQLQAELVTRVTRLLHTRMSTSTAPLNNTFLWNWFGFGGLQDTGYTLRGRVGQAKLQALFEP